jgi:hypothetical protein
MFTVTDARAESMPAMAGTDLQPLEKELGSQFSQLNGRQTAILEALLNAEFHFVTIERFERYLAVERDNFVALLDLAAGRVGLFGQVGYRLGEGIAMLLHRPEGNVFVWKETSVPATPELLKVYSRFKDELRMIVEIRPI